jgi:hypothetical protein
VLCSSIGAVDEQRVARPDRIEWCDRADQFVRAQPATKADRRDLAIIAHALELFFISRYDRSQTKRSGSAGARSKAVQFKGVDRSIGTPVIDAVG